MSSVSHFGEYNLCTWQQKRIAVIGGESFALHAAVCHALPTQKAGTAGYLLPSLNLQLPPDIVNSTSSSDL